MIALTTMTVLVDEVVYTDDSIFWLSKLDHPDKGHFVYGNFSLPVGGNCD
jgi:hypothetical protein